MAKITLEIDTDKLSTKGHEALKALMDDLSKPATASAPSQTIEHIADKVYARLARKESMRTVLDQLLDKGSLTYKEVCIASGHEKGGPALAGVLSSITRNWQRYHGVGKLMDAHETNTGDWIYELEDKGMLEPLRQAREKYRKSLKK